MDSGERLPYSDGEREQSVDELLADPVGYGERMRARNDAEAAEWVEREAAKRIEERRRSTWLGRLYLSLFGQRHSLSSAPPHDEPGSVIT